MTISTVTVTGVEWGPELGVSGNIGYPLQTWLRDGRHGAGTWRVTLHINNRRLASHSTCKRALKGLAPRQGATPARKSKEPAGDARNPERCRRLTSSI